MSLIDSSTPRSFFDQGVVIYTESMVQFQSIFSVIYWEVIACGDTLSHNTRL